MKVVAWWRHRLELAELRDRAVHDAQRIARLEQQLEQARTARPVIDWDQLDGLWWLVAERDRIEAKAPLYIQSWLDQAQASHRDYASRYGLDVDDRSTVYTMLATLCMTADAWSMLPAPLRCAHTASVVSSMASSIAKFVPTEERPPIGEP